MALSFDDIIPLLKSRLTDDERDNGVLYAIATPVKAGGKLSFPGVALTVPTDAFLAFVDRQPLANWGHPARYLLIDAENGGMQSVETRLPPFIPQSEFSWQVIYKAPGVPDTAIHKGSF